MVCTMEEKLPRAAHGRKRGGVICGGVAGTRVIGLTGGIGSGKSTVASFVRERGHDVVDADALAREIVQPGEPAHRELVQAFGHEILRADGSIDRPKLAALVFADEKARRTLNAITHPRIAAAAHARLAALRAEGASLAFYEAALLVENRLHELPGLLDALCVVALDPDEQIRRALERAGGGMSEEELRQRIAAQLPLAAKVAVADYVIDNGGTRQATRAQVDDMLADLAAGPRGSRKAR